MKLLGKSRNAWLLIWIGATAYGANPNAGLPPVPEYATDLQLEAHFASTPLSNIETEARKGGLAAEAEAGRRYLAGSGVGTNTIAALEWYQKAATNGFALAQYHLGWFYDHGVGVSKDSGEAARWYGLASEQGVMAAATNLGRLSLEKNVPMLQPKDAVRFYELAAEEGDLNAAVQLARLYANPPGGGVIDYDHSGYWLSFAASKNYVPAYSEIGWQYMQEHSIESHSAQADYQEARHWFSLGAEQNNAACQYGMAMWEWNVHESAPNIAEMREWLLKAAAANYPEAFYQLGRICALDGVRHAPEMKTNLTVAADWYRRGADLGSRRAEGKLAALTASGAVKSPDLIADLRRAADLDDANSEVELALRYLKGEGKPRNEADAPLALLQSALRWGNTRAALLLSDFYAEGKVVGQDRIQAMYYLFLAASFGSGEAYDRIARFRADTAAGIVSTNSLDQAFIDYAAAIQTSRPDPAVRLGRRYQDGTYTPDSYQAYIWFSVAARRNDREAGAEATRLLQQLDKPTQERAQRDAEAMYYKSIQPLPGF